MRLFTSLIIGRKKILDMEVVKPAMVIDRYVLEKMCVIVINFEAVIVA